ncbi:MAG: NADPH:quinone oxidoreductase family protein [Rhodocyclaceae bacterium]|jgi:NADPH2:quinone reductase|nr:NADPH:quinone oxidoreductase family protein [Rhodocyclaceae bacterium]
MKALQCSAFGPVAGLTLAEVPEPVAGEGELVVAVRAAGVNFPDALMVQGKYQVKPALPFTPGLECAGTVVAVGPDVADFRPGDRVVAYPPIGAFAERVRVPARRAFPIPATVDFRSAAAFLLTYGTSWHALVNCGRVAAGETLLVLGAAGGVGLAAVQIGKLFGARVIAAVSSADKRALCMRNGADEVIDYVAEDLKSRVRELTADRGADLIFDPVGGDFTEAALRSCAWRGRLLVVGFAAGAIPRLPANLILLKGCSAIGVLWGEYSAREPEACRTDMTALIARLAAGELKPHVSAVYPLTQAADALQSLLERRATGKVLIEP